MAQFKVEDMTCGHCASVITKAVQSVDPAAKVQIDLPTRTVYIEGDVSNAEAKRAIVGAGYTPE